MGNEVVIQTGYGYEVRLGVTVWDTSAQAWVPANCSSFVDTKIRFKKPNGVLVDKPASFYTDGTDGIFKYVVLSGVGLFDQKGYYEAELFLIPSGSLQLFPTSVIGFEVDNPL